ncbi:MAG: PqqD family protein [Chloroflexota bacterium]
MTTIHKETVYKQKEGLVWREVDDGLVIVAPNAGEVKALNQLGGQIWLMLEGRQTVDDIHQAIAAEYPDIDPEQLEQDVNLFIQSLLERNLLIQQNA